MKVISRLPPDLQKEYTFPDRHGVNLHKFGGDIKDLGFTTAGAPP